MYEKMVFNFLHERAAPGLFVLSNLASLFVGRAPIRRIPTSPGRSEKIRSPNIFPTSVFFRFEGNYLSEEMRFSNFGGDKVRFSIFCGGILRSDKMRSILQKDKMRF